MTTQNVFRLRDQELSSKTFKLRQYDPDRHSPYSQRLPQKSWDVAKPTLESLYEQGASRAVMLDALATEFHLHPSLYQLNSRMTAWGYKRRKTVSQSRDIPNPTEMASLQVAEVNPSQTGPVPSRSVRLVNEENWVDDLIGMDGLFVGLIDSGASMDRLERLCITCDVVDVLAYLNCCSNTSCRLVRYLISEIEDDTLLFTGPAFALTIINLLIWFRQQTDSVIPTWAFSQLRTRAQARHSPQDSAFHLLLCCRYFAYLQHPSIDWKSVISFENQKTAIWFREADFSHALIRASSLCSVRDTISALPASAINPRDQEMVGFILPWCSRQIRLFEIQHIGSPLSPRLSALETEQSCCLQLNLFLLKQWISHVDMITQIIPPGPSQPRSIPEKLVFKLTAQALSFVSALAVRKAQKFIKSRFESLDSLSRELTIVLQDAVREVAVESDNFAELVCQMPPRVSLNVGREDLPQATAIARLLTEEFWRIERFHFQTRHQHAYSILADEGPSLFAAEEFDSGDLMLWKPSSTPSSIRSLRRAGIRLRDRYGSPSTGSEVSLCSNRSSASMLVDTSVAA